MSTTQQSGILYVRWYEHDATENHILPADQQRRLHGGTLKHRTLCGKWFSDLLYRGKAPEDVSEQVRRGQFRNAVCPRCAEINNQRARANPGLRDLDLAELGIRKEQAANFDRIAIAQDQAYRDDMAFLEAMRDDS